MKEIIIVVAGTRWEWFAFTAAIAEIDKEKASNYFNAEFIDLPSTYATKVIAVGSAMYRDDFSKIMTEAQAAVRTRRKKFLGLI